MAKYPFHKSRGDRRTEDFLAMDAALCACHVPLQPKGLNLASLHGPKSQDRDSRVTFRTKTLRFQDQDLQKRDSRRLETKTQVSRTPSLVSSTYTRAVQYSSTTGVLTEALAVILFLSLNILTAGKYGTVHPLIK